MNKEEIKNFSERNEHYVGEVIRGYGEKYAYLLARDVLNKDLTIDVANSKFKEYDSLVKDFSYIYYTALVDVAVDGVVKNKTNNEEIKRILDNFMEGIDLLSLNNPKATNFFKEHKYQVFFKQELANNMENKDNLNKVVDVLDQLVSQQHKKPSKLVENLRKKVKSISMRKITFN